MSNAPSTDTTEAPRQRAGRSAVVQFIDRMPNWSIIVLALLLALFLLGAIVAFA